MITSINEWRKNKLKGSQKVNENQKPKLFPYPQTPNNRPAYAVSDPMNQDFADIANFAFTLDYPEFVEKIGEFNNYYGTKLKVPSESINYRSIIENINWEEGEVLDSHEMEYRWNSNFNSTNEKNKLKFKNKKTKKVNESTEAEKQNIKQIKSFIEAFSRNEMSLEKLHDELIKINPWNKQTEKFYFDAYNDWVEDNITGYRNGDKYLLSLTSSGSMYNNFEDDDFEDDDFENTSGGGMLETLKILKANKVKKINENIFNSSSSEGEINIDDEKQVATLMCEDGTFELGVLYDENGPVSGVITLETAAFHSGGFVTVKISDFLNLIKKAQSELDDIDNIM